MDPRLRGSHKGDSERRLPHGCTQQSGKSGEGYLAREAGQKQSFLRKIGFPRPITREPCGTAAWHVTPRSNPSPPWPQKPGAREGGPLPSAGCPRAKARTRSCCREPGLRLQHGIRAGQVQGGLISGVSRPPGWRPSVGSGLALTSSFIRALTCDCSAEHSQWILCTIKKMAVSYRQRELTERGLIHERLAAHPK